MSSGAIAERIAATKTLIDQLQKQADADKAADVASAATAKQQHEESEAADALAKAVGDLGISHASGADDIRKLSIAIASGHDATIPYNDVTLKASQVIDLLRAKATPAAAAIADLNKQLLEATTRAESGFKAMQLAANLKADPADTTGQGANLTDDQRNAMQTALDGIGAAQGRSAVTAAARRLALAQARQKQDNGLSAGLMQAGYDKQDFLSEHGTGAASSGEADQLFDSEASAARIEAMGRESKAASQAGNVVTELRSKLAGLNADMSGAGTQTAQWTAKLQTASPAVKAQAATILDLAAKIDAATKSQQAFTHAQEAMQALQSNLAKAQTDASDAAGELSDGPQLAFQRQLDRMKRQQAALVAAAQADTAHPNEGVQAQSTANQTYNTEALALIRQQVNANQEAAAQVLKSWDNTETGRRRAALDTVNMEKTALLQSINQFVTDENEKQQLSAETAKYIQAKTQEAVRQTEGPTSQLASQWSDTTALMDGATADFANNFVSTMSQQLSTGTASWKSFGQSVIAEIESIMIKAAMSGFMDMIGGSFTGGGGGKSGGGIGSILGSLGSLVGSFFHKGGIVGAGEQTFTRTVSPSVFARATKYHTGGIAGDEIPAILQRGEGVFTAGQMSAMGSALKSQRHIDGAAYGTPANSNASPSGTAGVIPQGSSGPRVTMNLHNQTGNDVKAASGTPKFDGESWVIDTVIKHATKPGNLRNILGAKS